MRCLILPAIALLTGCALSPVDVRQQGTRVEAGAYGSPTEVARCMQRNAEAMSGAITASVRPMADGKMEVVIRSEVLGVIALYELEPGGANTFLTGWIAPGSGDPDLITRSYTNDRSC